MEIRFSYPKLYPDTVFVFPCRRATVKDSQKAKEKALLTGNHFQAEFLELVSDIPSGFDDCPNSGLAEYFSRPELEALTADFYWLYLCEVSPPLVLASLRIVAQKALWLQKRRTAIGPEYYCPTCELPEKDLPKGCPRCRLTEVLDDYHLSSEQAILKRHKRLPEGWTMHRLFDLHSYVCELVDSTKDRILGGWDLFIGRCAEAVLSERRQAEYWKWWTGTVVPEQNRRTKQGKTLSERDIIRML